MGNSEELFILKNITKTKKITKTYFAFIFLNEMIDICEQCYLFHLKMKKLIQFLSMSCCANESLSTEHYET